MINSYNILDRVLMDKIFDLRLGLSYTRHRLAFMIFRLIASLARNLSFTG